MAIWLVFDKRYPLSEICVKAAKYGLFINNGKLFDSPNVHYNALRFGFASLNLEEMREVVEIIVKAIS
jgi:GntR family transcriptional regulator/MocR family aminotransferase